MIGATMPTVYYWNWVFPANRFCWSLGRHPGIRRPTNAWNSWFLTSASLHRSQIFRDL